MQRGQGEKGPKRLVSETPPWSLPYLDMPLLPSDTVWPLTGSPVLQPGLDAWLPRGNRTGPTPSSPPQEPAVLVGERGGTARAQSGIEVGTSDKQSPFQVPRAGGHRRDVTTESCFLWSARSPEGRVSDPCVMGQGEEEEHSPREDGRHQG